ncbi:deoxyguanosinetriphosphate triphosphohydrolase [Rhizobiaceae bacterium]|nr:deoxyguanosinetriphosphate triphosphohydrolase [Rhizobiaceae bacterium]
MPGSISATNSTAVDAPLFSGPSLAPWAQRSANSRGRLIAEPSSPTRSEYQRDRDRLIHSDAFRRLKHKTQVFVHHAGDHYRTRLSHTIEVAQIARSLARALGADEDLTEALALVHDFGHTPFGHGGETVLDERLRQATQGRVGFEHNAHSLRIVTDLERRYASFDGLNLTWETLEGLTKHNGPLTDRDGDGLDGEVPRAIMEYDARHPLQLWSWPSVEAQCAAIADDIAYDNHDLEDGLRAGLFALDDLAAVPFSAGLLAQVRTLHPGLDDHRTIHELIRRQITTMVEDVITESLGRLTAARPRSSDDVRALDYAVVAFSPAMEAQEKELKGWLFQTIYRHPTVLRPLAAAKAVLGDLFDAFSSGTASMPKGEEWSLTGLDDDHRAQRICDYLAGMTDRYALAEHERLFDRRTVLR